MNAGKEAVRRLQCFVRGPNGHAGTGVWFKAHCAQRDDEKTVGPCQVAQFEQQVKSGQGFFLPISPIFKYPLRTVLGMPSEITLDQQAFKALAGETRVALLKSLHERRKTQTELAKELNLSAPTVKDHLDILQSAGLVQEMDDGHKWKYFQLTSKARHLLNPEDGKILILLSVTMAAVLGLADERVLALCVEASRAATEKRAADPVAAADFTVDAIVQPANFNAPGQVVIAGSTDAVAAAIQLVKEGGDYKGGKAMGLAVSAPFHCSLMANARVRMAEIFSSVNDKDKPRELAFPYVPNRTARLSREPGLVLELLIEQIDHPVLWRQSVAYLLDSGFRRAVEFGPGKVLQNLAKRIPAADGSTISVTGVGDLAGLKAFEALK